MAIPRFFDRIADATLPLFEGVFRPDFHDRLAEAAVTLQAPEGMAADRAAYGGFLLAANLCARLYPRISLQADEILVTRAADLILSINPACDVAESSASTDCVLSWDKQPSVPGIFISASGWNAVVDRAIDRRQPACAPAALVAAAIGVGEMFRSVFADLLQGKGRRAPSPGGFNLVTLEGWSETPGAREHYTLEQFHLVGAGAIGQAAVLTFRETGAEGLMTVVDDQTVTSSNLQRYLLTTDSDEGSSKTDLVERHLEGSQLRLEKVQVRWGHDPRASAGSARVVLVAVDTAPTRIDLQAAIPCRIYNAFTGPVDLGWSRHERFGIDPCLACLYWPDRRQPSRYELIAKALGLHPLRVLSYIVTRIPIGSPLPSIGASLDLQPPPDAAQWVQRSLLEDIADKFEIQDQGRWANVSVEDLYHDGICGGGIVAQDQPESEDIVVPLAHQSTIAGIMLATQLIVALDPELSLLRPAPIEARYDVLAPPAQILPRPRLRTDLCLCADSDFVDRYHRDCPD